MDAQGFQVHGVWGRLEERGMIEEKYREAILLLAQSVPIIGKTGATIVDLADKTNKR